MTALRRGFAAAAEAQQGSNGATLQQKALIFTESRRTQEYLFRILEQTEFAGKVMLFNGTNSDAGSKEIYRRWLAKNEGTDRVSGSPGADMRAALVENFRDEAAIMIATEAAAEEINLQFCYWSANLVLRYFACSGTEGGRCLGNWGCLDWEFDHGHGCQGSGEVVD